MSCLNLKNEEVRICFVASSGGHLEEARCLKKIASKYPSILVTEREDYEIKSFCDQMVLIDKMNRKEIYSWIRLFLGLRGVHRFLKERKITHIVTTGAMCSFGYCLVAKFMGIKIIYIESFARTKSPSITGKLIYPISDLFIIQWKELKKYYPKAVYGGGIF